MPNKIERAQLEQLRIAAERMFSEAQADGRNISRRMAYDQVAKTQGFTNWADITNSRFPRSKALSLSSEEQHAKRIEQERQRRQRFLERIQKLESCEPELLKPIDAHFRYELLNWFSHGGDITWGKVFESFIVEVDEVLDAMSVQKVDDALKTIRLENFKGKLWSVNLRDFGCMLNRRFLRYADTKIGSHADQYFMYEVRILALVIGPLKNANSAALMRRHLVLQAAKNRLQPRQDDWQRIQDRPPPGVISARGFF